MALSMGTCDGDSLRDTKPRRHFSPRSHKIAAKCFTFISNGFRDSLLLAFPILRFYTFFVPSCDAMPSIFHSAFLSLFAPFKNRI